MKNHYLTLGLADFSDDEQVLNTFDKLSSANENIDGWDDLNTARKQSIDEAFDILLDKKRKARFDEDLEKFKRERGLLSPDHKRKISQENEYLSFEYFSNWKLKKKENTDTHFTVTLDSPSGSGCAIIYVFPKPINLKKLYEQALSNHIKKSFSEDFQVEQFKRLEKFEGKGFHIEGTFIDGHKGGVSAFFYTNPKISFSLTYNLYDSDKPTDLEGLDLIKTSFNLKLPSSIRLETEKAGNEKVIEKPMSELKELLSSPHRAEQLLAKKLLLLDALNQVKNKIYVYSITSNNIRVIYQLDQNHILHLSFDKVDQNKVQLTLAKPTLNFKQISLDHTAETLVKIVGLVFIAIVAIFPFSGSNDMVTSIALENKLKNLKEDVSKELIIILAGIPMLWLLVRAYNQWSFKKTADKFAKRIVGRWDKVFMMV